MTTANNPENQNPKGLPDLGQMWISTLESNGCVSRETVQCRDCTKARPEPESEGKVIYCLTHRQLRHIDTPRACLNYFEI